MDLNLDDPLLLAIIIIIILIAVLSIALVRGSNSSGELQQKSGSRNTTTPLIVVIIIFFILLIIVLFRERQSDLSQMRKVQDILTSEIQEIVKRVVETVSKDIKNQLPEASEDGESFVMADLPPGPKSLEAIRVTPPGSRQARWNQFIIETVNQEMALQIEELEKRLDKKIDAKGVSSAQVNELRGQISSMRKSLERGTERLQIQITQLEKEVEKVKVSDNSGNSNNSSNSPGQARYPSAWENSSESPITGPMPICSGEGAVAKIQNPHMLIRLKRMGRYPTSVDFLLTFPNGRTLNLEKLTPGTGKAFESDNQKPYFFQVLSIDNRCAMVSISSRNVE